MLIFSDLGFFAYHQGNNDAFGQHVGAQDDVSYKEVHEGLQAGQQHHVNGFVQRDAETEVRQLHQGNLRHRKALRQLAGSQLECVFPVPNGGMHEPHLQASRSNGKFVHASVWEEPRHALLTTSARA